MNIKKKFLKALSIIISILLVMSLCACSEKAENTSVVSTTTPETTTVEETTAAVETTTEIKGNTDTDAVTKEAVTTKKAETESKQTTKSSTTKKASSSGSSSSSNSSSSSSSSSNESSGSTSTGTHKHTMPTGNIGKWFNSRSELDEYEVSIENEWLNKYSAGTITWDEYIKNVPSGYEAWSCATCGKWTGNFKYR